MARPGPAPKDPAQRVRRNKDTNQSFFLSSNGDLVGPDLPSDREWGQATRDYYDTWRRSPQSRAFESTDWPILHLYMVAYDDLMYHSHPGKGISTLKLAEVRQGLSKFGATVEDRQKLRMSIIHGEELSPDNAAQLTDWASKYVPKEDS